MALALALAIESLLTIEWSFPYCNDQQDGPLSAVFGAPIPYTRWGGASSLEYDFVPHLYALNIVFLAAACYPLARFAVRALSSRFPGRAPHSAGALGALGALGCALTAAWWTLLLASGFMHPVTALAHEPYDRFWELRPVSLALSRHYECTPSTYWFPARWRTDDSKR